MAINEYMMELLEEMVKPGDMALENQVEDAITAEDDVRYGTAEYDDDIIEFIDNGGLGYENPVNFSYDVNEVIDDEE